MADFTQRKRIAIAAAILAALGACAYDSSDHLDNAPKVGVSRDVPGQFYTVEIDGKPCIVWLSLHDEGSNSAYSYSGLDCDWSPR